MKKFTITLKDNEENKVLFENETSCFIGAFREDEEKINSISACADTGIVAIATIDGVLDSIIKTISKMPRVASALVITRIMEKISNFCEKEGKDNE